MKYVTVGYHGKVWGIAVNQQIYYRNGVEGIWTNVAGSLRQIEIGKKDNVWGVNSYNSLFKRDGGSN